MIRQHEISGQLFDRFGKVKEKLTKPNILEAIEDVKQFWTEEFNGSNAHDTRELWQYYHERHHTNKANILFYTTKKEKINEKQIEVIHLFAQLYPIIQDKALTFKLAVTFEAELQTENEHYLDTIGFETLKQFNENQLEEWIRYFKESSHE